MGVNLGNIKRQFTCCEIDAADEYAYCGTKTVYFLEINLEKAIFKRLGPVKNLFSLGVNTMGILPNGDIIVGGGDGRLSKISIQTMQAKA